MMLHKRTKELRNLRQDITKHKSNYKEVPVGAEITKIKSDDFEENYIRQH